MLKCPDKKGIQNDNLIVLFCGFRTWPFYTSAYTPLLPHNPIKKGIIFLQYNHLLQWVMHSEWACDKQPDPGN